MDFGRAWRFALRFGQPRDKRGKARTSTSRRVLVSSFSSSTIIFQFQCTVSLSVIILTSFVMASTLPLSSRLESMHLDGADMEQNASSLATLCEYCKKMDFSQLRCPSFEDLTALSRGDPLGALIHFDAKSSVSTPVSLGTLARIKESTSTCSVCELIWKIMVRDNRGEEPDLVDLDAGGREKECFSYISVYGKFTDPAAPTNENLDLDSVGLHHLVRRLSLRIGVPPGPDEDDTDCFWWSIMFCLQGCAPEEASLSPPEAQGSASGSHAFVFGGRQRPLLVNDEWVRQWLHLCERYHDDNCGRTASLFKSAATQSWPLAKADSLSGIFPDFRLINVFSKCIEAFNSEEKVFPPYAALSYVWGKDQRLKLRTSNERSLMQPGAFDLENPSLTIVDAVDLVVRLSLLGIKHLWVDSLCIVQDSDVDKQHQITRMGEIYSNAAFTIIAAAGADAEASLPGIRPNSRTVNQCIVPIMPARTRHYSHDGLIHHEHGLAITDTLNPLILDTDDFWMRSSTARGDGRCRRKSYRTGTSSSLTSRCIGNATRRPTARSRTWRAAIADFSPHTMERLEMQGQFKA